MVRKLNQIETKCNQSSNKKNSRTFGSGVRVLTYVSGYIDRLGLRHRLGFRVGVTTTTVTTFAVFDKQHHNPILLIFAETFDTTTEPNILPNRSALIFVA